MTATGSAGDRTDGDVARAVDPRHIVDVAGDLGLAEDDLDRYGDDVAKLTTGAISRVRAERDADGALVLVTAMTGTPKGSGKTVTTIGLADALAARGERAVAAIREPSMGPVFGMKGGATGGGRAQVMPREDINLHFTGDIHAVTAAHDLLAAMLDAHVHHDNDLGVDVDKVVWPRALDVNDRALRETVIGLGGTANGPPRSDRFQITAASEVMAIHGLARDLEDLKSRLARIVVASDEDGNPITAGDLDAAGAMAALLKDARRPNLVQTLDGTPAFVHGGPFANIAHGTSSILADEMGQSLADYTVTEAGFGADLGFEKFGNIVARDGPVPDAVVVVASVRALKHHGLDMWPIDEERLAEPDPAAVRAGFNNLDQHLRTVDRFGLPAVVAVNRFPTDTEAEIQAIVEELENRDVPVAVSEVFESGAQGGAALADAVVDLVGDRSPTYEPLYPRSASLEDKIETVATEVYGAAGVTFTDEAREDLDRLAADGFGEYPVCIAKTPHSLTDDPAVKGAPTDWTLTVRQLYPAAGAGFVVALTGDVQTMPGLPADPAAERIGVESDGTITGLR